MVTELVQISRVNTLAPLLLLTTFFSACSSGKSTLPYGTPQEENAVIGSDTSIGRNAISSSAIRRWSIEGGLAMMRSEYERGIQWYEAILREVPEHPPTLAALARAYDALSLTDSAYSYALRAVQGDNTDIPSLKLLADILTSRGAFDSAATFYNQIVTLKPNDLQSRFMVARTWDHRNPREAITHYEYIRDNLAEDYTSLVNLYEMQVHEGRAADAAATLHLLILHNIGDGSLHELYCNTLVEAGEYQSARDGLEWASLYIELPEEREEFLLGMLQLTDIRLRGYVRKDSNFQRFVSELVGTAARECGSNFCLYQAGVVALRVGDNQVADSILNSLSKSNKLTASDWLESARLYRQMNQPERMLEVLGDGANHYRENPDVLFELGWATLKVGKREKGRTLLTSSTQMDPELGEAWKTLAEDYVATSNIPQAVGAYEQALAADPYDPELLNNYAHLLAEENIHIQKGGMLIDRALEMEPENERFLTTRGFLDYQREDYQSAASYLQKAIDAGGATAERYELLGDAIFALGEKEEAKRAWKEGLRLEVDGSERTARLQKKLNDQEL
ncbi:MAG: tetratricopeptide repeat protein [Ignavibacteriae bacterium]|nr:tetratricopeptide repeat protein [Ignavibacteriota bacterium]MCB9215341.1 tetratricopeptide repeat protein [Ignavibacteria bacterium]